MSRRGVTDGTRFRAARACVILARNPSGVCRPIGLRPWSCALQRTRLRLCRAYSGWVLACCCCAVRGGGLACQWSSSQLSSSCKTMLLRMGERTPPTILQTFFFEAEISRMLIDPEDHMHLVMVHFHPLHEGADQLASAGPLRFLQTVSHLRRKVFQSADDQLQLYVQGGFIHQLLGLCFQFRHPLSEVRGPGLELTLHNEPFGVTVDQPCQALPQLAQLPLDRGEIMVPGASVRVQPAAVVLGQTVGMLQELPHLAPH